MHSYLIEYHGPTSTHILHLMFEVLIIFILNNKYDVRIISTLHNTNIYTMYKTNIVTKMKTVYHRLTLNTINKSYTNNYIDKYSELVIKVKQQQQCVREEDRQANAQTSNVSKIQKQQVSRDKALEMR